jgi:hypothetical protein
MVSFGFPVTAILIYEWIVAHDSRHIASGVSQNMSWRLRHAVEALSLLILLGLVVKG